MDRSLPIVNLHEAKFECIFGRGCDGICCQEGEPPVTPPEIARLRTDLPRLMPLLRPEGRDVIARDGFFSDLPGDYPKLRVADNWCVFFNKGCVLHKLGAEEGDRYKYKPAACALFPLTKNEHGEWVVRQKGYDGEEWDLFCLDPAVSNRPAAETLGDEIALAEQLTAAATRAAAAQ